MWCRATFSTTSSLSTAKRSSISRRGWRRYLTLLRVLGVLYLGSSQVLAGGVAAPLQAAHGYLTLLRVLGVLCLGSSQVLAGGVAAPLQAAHGYLTLLRVLGVIYLGSSQVLAGGVAAPLQAAHGGRRIPALQAEARAVAFRTSADATCNGRYRCNGH